MPIFGPLNVEKLKQEQGVKGLIQALGYPKDKQVRRAAAEALGQAGAAVALDSLIIALTARDGITAHSDYQHSHKDIRTDNDCGGYHSDHAQHLDSGPGVEFPL
jgi:hypothetical protein